VLSSLAGVLRLASLAICLVVIASFALFVANKTSSASAHQQSLVNAAAPSATPAAPSVAPAAQGASPAKSSSAHESSLHRAIDDAANAFASPFSGVTAGSSNEWVIRGTKLLLVLIVYGFGFGFLARVIRVRV
jgi:hypothetical protein